MEGRGRGGEKAATGPFTRYPGQMTSRHSPSGQNIIKYTVKELFKHALGICNLLNLCETRMLSNRYP